MLPETRRITARHPTPHPSLLVNLERAIVRQTDEQLTNNWRTTEVSATGVGTTETTDKTTDQRGDERRADMSYNVSVVVEKFEIQHWVVDPLTGHTSRSSLLFSDAIYRTLYTPKPLMPTASSSDVQHGLNSWVDWDRPWILRSLITSSAVKQM